VITNTKAQNWATPLPIFLALHSEYLFTRDAAASPENAKLLRFWTEQDDALKQDWSGEKIFCNPPWKLIPQFLAKGLAHRDTTLSVFLLPASTDTRWFHELAVHFAKDNFIGRVAYVAPPGVKQSTPPAGSMVCICGPGVAPTLLGARVRSAKTGRLLPDPTAAAGGAHVRKVP